jgi:hypothetical protein
MTDGGWKQHWTTWLKKWGAWAIKNDEPHGECPTNSIRNTFASSSLKLFGADYTLKCMGQLNYQTLQKEYNNYRTKDQAQKLFAIKPPTPANLDAAELQNKLDEMWDLSQGGYHDSDSDFDIN